MNNILFIAAADSVGAVLRYPTHVWVSSYSLGSLSNLLGFAAVWAGVRMAAA